MRRLLVLLICCICFGETFAQRVKVEFVTPSIVRVRWSATLELEDNNTGVCIYPETKVEYETKDEGSAMSITSSDLKVLMDKKSFALTFVDVKSGKVLLEENQAEPYGAEPVYQEKITYDEKSARTEETANGKVTVKDIVRRDTTGMSIRYFAHFNAEGEKALYGLGCQMEDYLNLLGKTVYLTQHNLKVQIPVLLSTKGYGLLFDAGCAMKFSSTTSEYTMQIEAAKTIDFYFIKGEKLDDVVGGYRYLTGNVSLMPRYVFGYTQSKERYVSSDDIIKTLKEYRRRHVPIDMIVQDWNYWPQGWGYMKMNPKYYPDPKALADSVHAMNAKLMVSIWPNPQWCPEAEDFKSRGMMLEHDVYDVFNPEARKLYWKYANDEFFSKGFDAWWCDSSEPLDGDWNKIPKDMDGKHYGWDSQERRWELNKEVLSEALGAERSSLYSLYHSKGIYENQRMAKAPLPAPHEGEGCLPGRGKRVVNLTRSSYAGQQRYGTIVWNGDTHASWKSFKDQIPAGLNYMATGNPYWTVDVGSFFTKDDGRRWFYKGEFPEGVKSNAYKEYYVRMFQWGTFLPMLRSHGSDTPREIWRFGAPSDSPKGEEGLPDGKHGRYYEAILKMINLRYTLIPYIYSLAAYQSNLIRPTTHRMASPLVGEMPQAERGSYSMARMLAFDFANDENVLDIKDEYMFGDYLVCPVTDSCAVSRKVYLPKGTEWIDYWTNRRYEGGQEIEADATIDKLPLFVRNGSVIPTTEVAEYTDAQTGKPITINIYPGRDAEFTLYEDEGDNYNYEKGAYSNITLKWDDKAHTLTIADRQGEFPGMLNERTFITKTITKTKTKTKTITYSGKEMQIKL